jgi:hypothetical protein
VPLLLLLYRALLLLVRNSRVSSTFYKIDLALIFMADVAADISCIIAIPSFEGACVFCG